MSGTAAQGLLSAIVDPLNRRISFDYFQDGRAYAQIEPGNAKRIFQYSPFLYDKFTRVLNNDNTVSEFKFDDEYRTVETRYADGARVKQAWNNDNLVTSINDELGYTTQFTFDSKGNTIGIKRPEDSSFTQIQYEQNFNKPTKIIPLTGSVTDFSIDSNNGSITQIKKNLNGTDIALVIGNDPFGNPITFNNGRVNYANATNANGLLTSISDLHNPETRSYDVRGRLATRSFANGRTIALNYDDYDRVTSISDNAGPGVVNQYDTIGRLISKTVTDGTINQITAYSWDDRDRLISTTDAMNRTTNMQYDIMNVGCNVIDKVTMIIDPSGRKTSFEYDQRQRLTKIIDPRNGITRFEYDLKGNMIALTDAENNRTRFFYDGNSRVTRKESPSVATLNGRAQAVTFVTKYTYNEIDQLIKEEKVLNNEPAGSALVTENQYNDLGRLIAKTQKKVRGNQILQIQDQSVFSYENQIDSTLLKTANNGNANLGFEYESAPPFALKNYSVASAQSGNPLNLIEGGFSYTRDNSGEVIQIKRGTQTLITSTYDQAARLKTIAGTMGSQTLSATLNYDGFGRKQSVAYNNGMQTAINYDPLNRITSINTSGGGESFSETLTYALSGNISAIARENGSFTFGYDETDQLLSSAYTGSVVAPVLNRSFLYDLGGNRTNDSITGASQVLRNVLLENQETTFYPEHTGTGNLAQKTNKVTGESDAYGYRADGKMISFARYSPQLNSYTTEASYYFDALGRRIAKKIRIGSQYTAQSFCYKGDEDKILFGKTGNGLEFSYIDGQGIDEHFGHLSNLGTKPYVSDHLGTVINSEALGINRITGIFGEATSQIQVISSSSEPVLYGYMGRQNDNESDLNFFRDRMQLPTAGIFTRIDSIFPRGGMNPYVFVKNNPVRFTDPWGLAPGDSFSSPSAAASDAFGYIYSSTAGGNTYEYAGYVYQQSNGSYSYTSPASMFSSRTSNPGEAPVGATAVYHTHPIGAPIYDSENFSPEDIRAFNQTLLQGFVGTAGGSQIAYDPFTALVTRQALNSCRR